jgi:hypothetical protein
VCVWAWDGRKKTRTDGCKAMSEEEYGRKNESMTRVSKGGDKSRKRDKYVP